MFSYQESKTHKERINLTFSFKEKQKMANLAGLIVKAGGNRWSKNNENRVYFPNFIVDAAGESLGGVYLGECYLDQDRGTLHAWCHEEFLDKVSDFKSAFVEELKAALRGN